MNLTSANPSFHRDISGANNPMFGKPGMAGKANPMYGKRMEQSARWKGGRKIRKDGYILVAVDQHPYPAGGKASGTGYVLEHRLVMEKHLGRYLEPAEVVHHIDGNPSNNDISNLKLYASNAEHIRIEHPDSACKFKPHRQISSGSSSELSEETIVGSPE